jgi:hypothetical protein
MILGCDGCDNAVEEAVMKVAYNEPGWVLFDRKVGLTPA